MSIQFRGITLLPVMEKLFTAILRDRLLYWAEHNNKLGEAQFGFRQGRRTTDAIFVITTAIQSHKKINEPLFACFVDFAKASDSVHQLLWEKLYVASMGVSTKIIRILYYTIINVHKSILESCSIKQTFLFVPLF